MLSETTGVFASVLATFLGALLSFVVSWAKNASPAASLMVKMIFPENPPAEETAILTPAGNGQSPSPAQAGLNLRMREVKGALRKQRALALGYRCTNSLLTIGQFLVGGLLASSFLQEQLSKPTVGALGLVVLASSLLRQHFRPDVELVGALQRAARLRSLLREAEDNIFLRSEGEPDAPSITKIRKMLSAGLSEAEDSELRGAEAVIRPGPSKPRVPKTAGKGKNPQ